jgi:hypothetical protein
MMKYYISPSIRVFSQGMDCAGAVAWPLQLEMIAGPALDKQALEMPLVNTCPR